MKIALLAVTKNGSALAMKIGALIGGDIYLKDNFEGSLAEVVERIFKAYDALVFIMACGIVVRTIAPFIESKTTDPAVLVLDEKGKFVISLLSGHMGGANKLSEDIAKRIDATPVITTSTDINGVIAFDVFAVENNLKIENIKALKYISGALVNGEKVGFWSDCAIKGSMPQGVDLLKEPDHEKPMVVLSNRLDLDIANPTVLWLRPKNLILGLGCKRGTSQGKIGQAIEEALSIVKKSIHSVKCIATIDKKSDEKGLIEYCNKMDLELTIIPTHEIEKVENNYRGSAFVKSNVGVACVAEPCAMLASQKGQLIMEKTSFGGITIAIKEEAKEYHL